MDIKRASINENFEIILENFHSVSKGFLFYESQSEKIVPIGKENKLLVYNEDLTTAEMFSYDMNEEQLIHSFKSKITNYTRNILVEKNREIEKISEYFNRIILKGN